MQAADGTPQVVAVTITGSNDAPVLTITNASSLTRTLSLTDVDSAQPQLDVSALAGWTAVTATTWTKPGNFGTVTLNWTGGATATLSYQAQASLAETQALINAQQDLDKFVMVLRDSAGLMDIEGTSFAVTGTQDAVAPSRQPAPTAADLKIVDMGTLGEALFRLDGTFFDPDGAVNYSVSYVNSKGQSQEVSLVSTVNGLIGRLSDWTWNTVATTKVVVKVPEAAPNQNQIWAYEFDLTQGINGGQIIPAKDTLTALGAPQVFEGTSGDDFYSVSTAITDNSAFIARSGSDVVFANLSDLRDLGYAPYLVPARVPGFINASLVGWDAALSDQVYGSVLGKYSLESSKGPGLVKFNFAYGGGFISNAENIILEDAAGVSRSGFSFGSNELGLVLQLGDNADYLVNGSKQGLVSAGAGDDTVWALGSDLSVPRWDGSEPPTYVGPPKLSSLETMPTVQGGSGDDTLLAGQGGRGVRDGTDAATQRTSIARIEGGSGDDALVAVSGTVYAKGDGGRDSFALFSDSRNVHLIIQDFNATTDVIDLSALVRNASGSLTAAQVEARKAAVLADVLQGLEGQTHTQAVEVNVSKWLDGTSGATVAKVYIEFESNAGVSSTVLSSHNFVFDAPNWRDLEPFVNGV